MSVRVPVNSPEFGGIGGMPYCWWGATSATGVPHCEQYGRQSSTDVAHVGHCFMVINPLTRHRATVG